MEEKKHPFRGLFEETKFFKNDTLLIISAEHVSLLGPSPAFPSDEEVRKDRAVRVQLAAVPTVLRWVGSRRLMGNSEPRGLFFF